jgi:hypothetical protein
MTPRLCSVAGCPKPHYGRGWCRLHYKRWRKFGDDDYCFCLEAAIAPWPTCWLVSAAPQAAARKKPNPAAAHPDAAGATA